MQLRARDSINSFGENTGKLNHFPQTSFRALSGGLGKVIATGFTCYKINTPKHISI